MTVDRFWTQADATLDELGIHGAPRLAMEATIAARVLRPDLEALAEHRRSFKAWKAGLQAMAQNMGSRRRQSVSIIV